MHDKAAQNVDAEAHTTTWVVSLGALSPADFGRLGAGHIAYVRPVVISGTRAFAICAADGTQMAVAPDAALAAAAIRQHEMEPLSVH
jgi:hypothetical protein